MSNMKKLGMVWGIIVILIFALLTIFGFMYKNKSSVYKDLEKKLVEAEKKYADHHFAYPENGKILKTDAAVLIEEGFLDSLEIDGKICTGYAIVSHDSMVFDYKGYVSCENYKTKGYDK